jgi:signal transduction histidine kinase
VDDALAPRVLPPLRAIRARAAAVQDALRRATDTGVPALWIAARPDGPAIGVVSPEIVVTAGEGAVPARIVGEVPAAVVRERVSRHLEDVARDQRVAVALIAPDGATVLARSLDVAPQRPVVASASLEPPFDAWRVEVVAASDAGVPATVWMLAAAVAATAAALVWGVLALRRAAQEQARLADERRSFLDHVAHEVRTPAGALLALGEELAAGRVPAERQPQYHAHLAEEARRLARLVEDTLDLSRLDAGKLVLDLRETDLRSVVAEGLQAAGAEGRVTVRAPDARVLVLADAPALRRVVRNLVDNALRHGAASPRPEVTLSDDGRLARVAVRDHGRGIRPEHLPRLFDRFWRAPSVTHETKGVGVGLAICREIARAHGGDIDVASEPGRGAVFTLVLPSAGGSA